MNSFAARGSLAGTDWSAPKSEPGGHPVRSPEFASCASGGSEWTPERVVALTSGAAQSVLARIRCRIVRSVSLACQHRGGQAVPTSTLRPRASKARASSPNFIDLGQRQGRCRGIWKTLAGVIPHAPVTRPANRSSGVASGPLGPVKGRRARDTQQEQNDTFPEVRFLSAKSTRLIVTCRIASPTPSAHRVSHPLSGLIPPEPCGLVSCHFRP